MDKAVDDERMNELHEHTTSGGKGEIQDENYYGKEEFLKKRGQIEAELNTKTYVTNL